jgi:hypothetical protein
LVRSWQKLTLSAASQPAPAPPHASHQHCRIINVQALPVQLALQAQSALQA